MLFNLGLRKRRNIGVFMGSAGKSTWKLNAEKLGGGANIIGLKYGKT
jgi:hypothetical protein